MDLAPDELDRLSDLDGPANSANRPACSKRDTSPYAG